jgi:hypothetical protein
MNNVIVARILHALIMTIWIGGDLLPVLPPFIGRVCSGYAPGWGVLQTLSV